MRYLLLYLFVALATTACKKEKQEDPEPAPPVATSRSASFTATRTLSDYGDGVPVSGYAALAQFLSPSRAFEDVDSVEVNGLRMARTVRGQYAAFAYMGLDLSTEDLTWTVGAAATGIDFTHAASDISYPTLGAITSVASVPRGGSFTLRCASMDGADSVVFVLGSLRRMLAGTATSCTFSAAEVATLGPELYRASITAVRVQRITLGGVNGRFAKEDERSMMVLVE